MSFLEKAKDSEAFLEAISSYNRHLNWEIIVIFYASLQYVDFYLKGKLNLRYNNHNTRNDLITEHLVWIWPVYQELYNASIQARYIPEFKANMLLVDFYKKHIIIIKKHIFNLLRNPPN